MNNSLVGVGVGFTRTVRITGYCSNITRVNDAKQDEIKDRTTHSLCAEHKVNQQAA